MRLIEMFKSIEGEGIRAGLTATFIRLAGCNLCCNYCDTKYAQNMDSKEVIIKSIDEIIRECARNGTPLVTITGGEPFLQNGTVELIETLIAIGCEVNVETNGTFPVPEELKYSDSVILTMDWKCAGSGMGKSTNINNVNSLRDLDVLKFVVSDISDLDEMVGVVDIMKSKPQIYVSPVYGKIELRDIAEYILEHGLYYVRIQTQLHKIIWNPEMRGV